MSICDPGAAQMRWAPETVRRLDTGSHAGV